MQEILQRFESTIDHNDLISAPRLIEQLVRIYVSSSASPELRSEVTALLRRKAEESSSRAFTMYLRSVADCVERSSDALTDKCVEEQESSIDAGERSRRLTDLGEYMRRFRANTPVP